MGMVQASIKTADIREVFVRWRKLAPSTVKASCDIGILDDIITLRAL